MFLISQEIPPKYAKYHFHPYKFGAFSAKMYQDLSVLEKRNLITQQGKEHIFLTEIGDLQKDFPISVENYLNKVLKEQNTLEKLIDFVYDKYPEYSLLSERKYIPIIKNRENTPGIFLIGYEGRDIDEFLNVLIQNNIEILIDIRANPHSMKFDFIGTRLQRVTERVGARYIHIPELGIKSEDRKNLSSDSDYKMLFSKYRSDLTRKEEFLKEVIKLGKNSRIALMCFEKDPKYCHRGQIGQVLQERQIKVKSI